MKDGSLINLHRKEPETTAQACASLVKAAQVGDLCPTCRQGRLDYDGQLNLACPK